MARRERILAYDALRVFAIVTVVAIHTLMPYRVFMPPTSPVRVFDDLLHYAVPLFVFISGVFAWARPLPAEPGAFRRFLARRVSVILVPYLAWSAIYLIVLVVTSGPPPVLRTVGLLLVGHTWYHLYFIPMLLTFYLLTPLATRIGARSPELLLALCYAVRILLGPTLIAATTAVAGELGGAYANHVVTHLPHMALGAWFAVRYDATPRWVRRSWPLMLAAGTVVLAAASLGARAELPAVARPLVYPLGMAATVFGMALGMREAEPALESRRRMRSAVLATAPLAFGVYFVHPLLLLAVFELVPSRPGSLWTVPGFAFAVFAGVTAASLLVASLLARNRYSCRLVGASPG